MDLPSFAEMHHRSEDPYLPPGFRFHPTDEELVYYLTRKVLYHSFRISAITEVDLNKCEPWDLPAKATMGEKEWYFYTLRDRKYPTGMRTNRATEAGYWKATGKDRNVMSSRTSSLVGMKKTLVFYRGRAPKGVKSNWIMHEYRLEGEASHLNRNMKLPKDAEWVVCRIFQKVPGGKSSSAKTANAVKVLPSEQTLPALLEEPTRVTVTTDDCAAAESESSQNDHIPSLSGNSYISASFPKERTWGLVTVAGGAPLESSAHPSLTAAATTSSSTDTITMLQNPSLSSTLIKVPPVFFASPNTSSNVPLDHHSFTSYPPSFLKFTHRTPEFNHGFQQESSPDITSLKALDQFSRALAGPYSVTKTGIRACKAESRTGSGYHNGFKGLDISVAGWLSDTQSLPYCTPQQHSFATPPPAPPQSAVAQVPGSGGSDGVYRLPSTTSSAEIEPLWNY